MDGEAPEDRAGGGSSRRGSARVRTDARGIVRTVDPAFTALFGFGPDELLGRRLGELAHPDDLARGLASWARLAAEPAGTVCSVRLRYRHRDGHWVWTDVTSTADPDGDVVTDLVDVGAEVARDARLAARDQLLAHLSDVARVGLFHADGDGTLRYASRRLEELTMVEGAATLAAQLGAVAEADRARFRAALQQAAGGSESVVELAAGPEGGRRWLVNLRPLRDPAGTVTGVSGCLEDATERHGTDRDAPDSDPLTGCLTATATLAALDDVVARHEPGDATRAGVRAGRRQGDGRGTAVIVVDLAHLVALGTLHERYGQPALDELLRLVALRIVDTVRATDVVGRTGDVEFAALCAGVPGPTTARSIGRSILKQLTAPIVLRTGGPVSIRPGLGVAWTSRSGVPAADLLRRAQDAAIASKLSDPAEPVLAEASVSVSPPAPPR